MTNGKSSIGSLHLLQPGGEGGVDNLEGRGGGVAKYCKIFHIPSPICNKQKKIINNNNNNNNEVKPLLSGHLRDLNRGCLPNRSS